MPTFASAGICEAHLGVNIPLDGSISFVSILLDLRSDLLIFEFLFDA